LISPNKPNEVSEGKFEKIKQVKEASKAIDKSFTKCSKTGTSNEIPILSGVIDTTQTLSKV